MVARNVEMRQKWCPQLLKTRVLILLKSIRAQLHFLVISLVSRTLVRIMITLLWQWS